MKTLLMEQNSPEWYQARAGILTASKAACLLVKGKGVQGLGAGALTLMDEMIGERITGEAAEGWGGNEHTERGHELEPEAIGIYLDSTGTPHEETSKAGIILNHGCGYSPDLLIRDDGALEVKTKMAKFQVKILAENKVPKEHIPQIMFGLWVSERDWCDFISYCRGMPPFIQRVHRDEKEISHIVERVDAFYSVMGERIASIMKHTR